MAPAAIAVALALRAAPAPAQAAPPVPAPAPAPAPGVVIRDGSRKRFAAGFATGIPAHEAGHVAASLLQGGHPTIGRTGSVSDVAFMERTSSLSYAQIALIYGGVAALHVVRIERDGHHARFFVQPDARAGLRVGMDWR